MSSLFSLHYISLAFTQCCPSSVSPSRCLRWSPSWRRTSVSTSVACELTYHGRRCILFGLETAQLSITELKMVSDNPTPIPNSGNLSSFAKVFSWTLTFPHILSPYFLLCEFESVAVGPLSGACPLEYNASAALISASVDRIMTQPVASTMSHSTTWWH